eukprot:scaffold1457_cov111-Skeletonema_dohrnii-CCMP3373.AAC.5
MQAKHLTLVDLTLVDVDLIMAAEIAREIIIAQSKGSSKLAFSFFYWDTDCNLRIFSSTCVSNESNVYSVFTTNGNDKRVYELRCNDISSAATLVEGLLEKNIRSLVNLGSLSVLHWSKAYMKLVFYEGGVVGADFLLTYHFPESDQRGFWQANGLRHDFLEQKLTFLNKIDVMKSKSKE